MVQMTGYLEKQSTKNPDVWKRRWFVMQESALFFYRSESDAIETKPSDRTCCGTIPLDSVHSVTTAVRLLISHDKGANVEASDNGHLISIEGLWRRRVSDSRVRAQVYFTGRHKRMRAFMSSAISSGQL
jgi:hypothetical protein